MVLFIRCLKDLADPKGLLDISFDACTKCMWSLANQVGSHSEVWIPSTRILERVSALVRVCPSLCVNKCGAH